MRLNQNFTISTSKFNIRRCPSFSATRPITLTKSRVLAKSLNLNSLKIHFLSDVVCQFCNCNKRFLISSSSSAATLPEHDWQFFCDNFIEPKQTIIEQ